MANYYSIRDGLITDASTYGYSVTPAEVLTNTSSVNLLTSPLYLTNYNSTDVSISAIAVQLAERSATPMGVLELELQGIANSKVFLDNSPNKSAITTVGSVYQNRFGPHNPNGWSCYFNGANYLTLPYSNNFSFPSGTAFTIECWFSIANNSPLGTGGNIRVATLISTSDSTGWNGYTLFVLGNSTNTGTGILFRIYGAVSSTANDISVTVNIPKNVWHHLAVVRESTNTIYLYLNGTRLTANATTLPSYPNITGTNFGIGRNFEGAAYTYFLNGSISNLRIVKNQAIYTSNFTPPTANFGLTDNGGAIGAAAVPVAANVSLLTLQDNRIKDNSNNNLTITSNGTILPSIKAYKPFPPVTLDPSIHGGSGFFSGAASYLRAPEIVFRSNNFTVEFWAYLTTSTAQQVFIGQWSSALGGTGLSWVIATANNTSRFLRFLVSSNGSAALFDQVTTTQIPLNTWNHIALTRDTGGVYRIFLNGVLCGNGTVTNTAALFDATNELTIGGNSAGTQLFAGYMSDVRILNGTALYTSNFTPPTSLLTAIPNTSLLLNANNFGVSKASTTQTYSISSFTRYGGLDSLTNVSRNWQLLKLSNLLTPVLGETINFNLKTTNANQLSLMGSLDVIDATGLNSPYTAGTIALSSTKPYSNFGNSFILNGTDNWFVSPASPLFNLDGDFTIECWVNTNFFSYDTFAKRIFSFGANATNNLQVIFYETGAVGSSKLTVWNIGTNIITGTINVADGNWHHVAVARYNNSISLYVDGIQSGPIVANTTVFNAGVTNPLSIGSYNNSANGRFDGLINEFRIVNGTAVYTTETFDPPTTPLSYIPDTVFLLKNGVDFNKMFIANKSYVDQTISVRGNPLLESTIKPYSYFNNSLNFNGLTDYLEVPASPYFNFDKDFTIEFWINTSIFSLDGVTSRRVFNFSRSSIANTLSLAFWNGAATSNLGLWSNGIVGTGTIPVANGIWHHVALSRKNSVLKLFVDGNQSFSVNNSVVYNAGVTEPLFIGTSTATTGRLNGYINEFRITNGIGLYTAPFTPPTQPFTSTFSTVLLLKTGTSDIEKVIQQDVLPLNSTDSIHIGSTLIGYTTELRTVTANTLELPNLYIHNKGTLCFSMISSTVLTVNGSNGLQITSEGTVQVGTSSSPVQNNIVHQIILDGNTINVNSGGILDVYGAYKVPYTKLTTPSIATARTFTVVDNVSSNWQVNDTLVFIPNTTQPTSYDTLVLSAFDSDTTFRTATSAVFAHTVLDYVPNVANLTRNVKIGGTSTAIRGSIYATREAKVNINNAEFKFIDTSLQTGVDSNGLFSVNGCTLSGNGTENLITPATTEYATVFNGTNAYITGSLNNTDFDIDINTDFTFECFLKPTDLVYQPIFRIGNIKNDIVGDLSLVFLISGPTADNGGVFAIGGPNPDGSHNGQRIVIPLSYFKVNVWQHFAAVGRNGRVYVYVDGNLYGSIPNVNFYFASTFLAIIGQYNSINGDVNSFYDGKMTNLRFVKGRAMYTGSKFTPPIDPLTEITDTNVSTALLTLQDSVTIDNSYKKATLTPFNVTTVLDTPFVERVYNANINNTITFKTKKGITFDRLLSNNNTVTNNLILNSTEGGIYVNNGLSGNLTFNGNIAVGPSPYGTFIENNITGKILSGLVNYNNTTGMIVNNAHAGCIDNVISTHNSTIGILVDGTISQLNETSFTNITASNNRTLGFFISGNPIDLLSPITLNINNLVANNNLSGGFEGYSITGNLTALELNRNGFYGMKTSIGNGPLTINGITALMNNVASTSAAVGILSGFSYFPIIIKNANLGRAVATSTFGSAISLDSTKFLEFVIMNSTLSGGARDLELRATRSLFEGSYLISNTNVSPLPLGTGITRTNYQTDVFKTAGFVFTNVNNATGYNIAYFAAGNRLSDYTITYNVGETASPSERLTPQSTTLKLRSGSKFVALNQGEFATISVFARRSRLDVNGAAYNGNPPRLMLKRNGAMGMDNDVVLARLYSLSNNFSKLQGVTPVVTDAGVLEFYVDCDGTEGWINIDNWEIK
jgi:hypothetical protein